jgi:hypothetical protein
MGTLYGAGPPTVEGAMGVNANPSANPTAADPTAPALGCLRPGTPAAVWSPSGALGDRTMQLPAGWAESLPVRYDDFPYLKNFIRAVTPPADAATGPAATGVMGLKAAVLKPLPTGPVATIRRTEAAPAAAITKALANGARVVRFEPGSYALETSTRAPVGIDVVIDGEGLTRLTRVPNGEYGERMFALDDGAGTVHLRGLTFRHLGYPNLVLHGNGDHTARNLTVEDCTVERGQLMRLGLAPGSSVTVRRVTFRHGAGTGDLPSGSWLDLCEFRDSERSGQHACFVNGASNVLVTSCDWWGTARGIVCQGAVGGCAFIGCRFFNVARGQQNAGELILFENDGPGEVSNNLVYGCHAVGCTGPGVSLFGAGIRGNRVENCQLDCLGWGIYLAGTHAGGSPITGNLFAGVEAGGGVFVGGNATGNDFRGVVARAGAVSCGNQDPAVGIRGGPDNYRQGPPFVDTSAAQDNTYFGCYAADGAGKRRIKKLPGLNRFDLGDETSGP